MEKYIKQLVTIGMNADDGAILTKIANDHNMTSIYELLALRLDCPVICPTARGNKWSIYHLHDLHIETQLFLRVLTSLTFYLDVNDKHIKSIHHLTKTAAFQIVSEYQKLRKRILNDEQFKRSLNLAFNMVTNELANLLKKFWTSKLSLTIRNDFVQSLRILALLNKKELENSFLEATSKFYLNLRAFLPRYKSIQITCLPSLLPWPVESALLTSSHKHLFSLKHERTQSLQHLQMNNKKYVYKCIKNEKDKLNINLLKL